jgi:hypothetical protein
VGGVGMEVTQMRWVGWTGGENTMEGWDEGERNGRGRDEKGWEGGSVVFPLLCRLLLLTWPR